MLENRIMQVFAYSNLSRLEFASRLGISNAVLSHISSGRNKASIDLVMGILTHFPEISSDWLLLEKGEMLRQDNARKLNLWKGQTLEDLNRIKQSHHDLQQQIIQLESTIMKLE